MAVDAELPPAVGSPYDDAVDVLKIIREAGLHDPEYEHQCDEEMTVNMWGYGTASCIVKDEDMSVGVDSNLIRVHVYADEEHAREFLAENDLPVWHGNGYFVTAPSEELIQRAEEAILAQVPTE